MTVPVLIKVECPACDYVQMFLGPLDENGRYVLPAVMWDHAMAGHADELSPEFKLRWRIDGSSLHWSETE